MLNKEDLISGFENYERALFGDYYPDQDKSFIFLNDDDYSDYSYSDYSDGDD